MTNRKRLQLLFQGRTQRPSPVDVAWRVAVGSWSVVDNELHNMCEFPNFVWEALHYVLDEHAEYLLSLLMMVLD